LEYYYPTQGKEGQGKGGKPSPLGSATAKLGFQWLYEYYLTEQGKGRIPEKKKNKKKKET